MLVQRTRDQLLAGAALAGDEHRDIERRDSADAVEQLAHCRRVADHAGKAAQQQRLAPSRAKLRTLEEPRQHVGAERLQEIFHDRCAHGAQRAFHRRMAGHDRDLTVRGDVDRIDEIDAVAIRQIEIDHDQIELLVRDELACFMQCRRAGRLAGRELREIAQRRLKLQTVVDDEHVACAGTG
jgi:hypothetical protein